MSLDVLDDVSTDQKSGDDEQRESSSGGEARADRYRGMIRRLPRLILMVPIKAYQLTFSVLRGPVCRFYPSCSAYAMTALSRHGAIKGTYLAIHRILRCHPWNPGGVDHVPEVGQIRRSKSESDEIEP